jgi:hypothetical protein
VHAATLVPIHVSMNVLRLWALVALLASSGPAFAGDWSFEDCASALDTPEFQPLRAALERARLAKLADSCLALAPPREYVVLTWQQIYYCDVSSESGCVENTQGYWYPGLRAVRRISGANNNQFVLFKNGGMQHGLVGSGYHVFQLVPKSKNRRGYELYRLAVGDHYFLGEGGLPPCRDLAAEDKATEVKRMDVSDERSSSVTLRFDQLVTPCNGGEPIEESVEFNLIDGMFQKR